MFLRQARRVQSNIEVTSTITTDNISTAGIPVIDYIEVVDEQDDLKLASVSQMANFKVIYVRPKCTFYRLAQPNITHFWRFAQFCETL